MKATTFFRFALLLPILLPLLLLPFKLEMVSALLLLSLGFGGVQYIFFAVVAFLWLGRINSIAGQIKFLWLSPFLFIPFQMLGWLIYFQVERLSNPNLTGEFSALLPMVVYSLLIGYFYVLIVYFVFVQIQKLKLLITKQ